MDGQTGQLEPTSNRLDLILIAGALNEVLHGPGAIEDWEFDTRLGATRDEATRLLGEVNRVLGPPSAT